MATRKHSQKNDASRGVSTSGDHIISCSIKILPEDQWEAAAETAVRVNPANSISRQALQIATGTIIPPAHLALLVAKRWPTTGVHLTVGFIETVDATLRAR